MPQQNYDYLELLRVNGPGVGLGAKKIPECFSVVFAKTGEESNDGSREHGQAIHKLTPCRLEVCSSVGICYTTLFRCVPVTHCHETS